jgi:cell division septum initiation protein DivIVA
LETYGKLASGIDRLRFRIRDLEIDYAIKHRECQMLKRELEDLKDETDIAQAQLMEAIEREEAATKELEAANSQQAGSAEAAKKVICT